MPLSEVHKTTTQGKLENMQSKMSNYSSDLSSFMADNEFVELLWENGQIVVQGQANRQKKTLFNHPVISPTGKAQEKDASPKFGRFGAMDSMVNDLSPTVPSGIGLNTHDDEMTPWMNYPIEETLQNDYCTEFLSEFSGVDLNSVATDNGSMPADRNTGFNVGRDYHQNVEHGPAASRIRTTQLFHLSQECQSSTTSGKLRAAELSNHGSSSVLDNPSGDSLDIIRSQRQDFPTSKTLQPGSGMGLMNFSHFSRPVVFAKANLQSADRLRSNEKASTTGVANPSESSLINCSSGFRSSSAVQGNSASGLLDLHVRPSTNTPPNGVSVAQTEAIHREDASRSKKNSGILANNVTRPPDHSNHQNPVFMASMVLGRHEMEKAPEAVVASSVCSGNSAGAGSSDLKHNTKRKVREGEETEYQSENVDDESVGLKKPPPARGTSAKRNRAAEVHNLSERRRRDRINERMRALQELIPNCNKVDKASMLDEAIEYLKTLQLQVQMMSMGSGLYMPSMMLPPGMQHIRAPPMAHYSPMGVGLGMGMGMGMGCRMGMLDMNGSPGCPLIPVPPMHGPQFPCPSIPGAPGLHGMPASAGLQMFGVHGQGVPASTPRPPRHINSFPVLPIRPNMAPDISAAATTTVPLTAAATASPLSSKDQQHQSRKLEKPQKASTDGSLVQASIQETKQGAEQSTSLPMSDQGLRISGNGAISSIRENGARAT